MNADKNGNVYAEIGNIRITLVDNKNRNPDKDWAGKDTLRFQAYKGENTSALHLGAEIPLDSKETIVEVIEALCKLYKQNGERK